MPPETPNPAVPGAPPAPEDQPTKFMTDLEEGIHGDRVTDDGATPPAPTTTGPEDEGGQGPRGDEEEIVLDIDEQDVQVGEDGKLIFVVDPDDPKSNFYTGKDMKELMANIRKSMSEKDKTIRSRASSERVTATEDVIRKVLRGPRTQEEAAASAPILPPNYNTIESDVCREAKIDPAVLRWTNQEWKDLQTKKELDSWQIMEMRQTVKEVVAKVEKEYNDKNTDYINGRICVDEAKEVGQLLTELEVDPKSFDFETVLETIADDPSNYDESGVLRHGRLVRACAVEIQKIARTKVKTKVEEEIDERIARGEAERRKVPSESRAPKAPFAGTKKTPRTSEEALQQTLQEYRASLRRRPPSAG